MTNRKQMRAQQRAAKASGQILDVRDKGKKVTTKYNSRIQKLPVLLRVNGLIQTLAFLESKAKRDADKRGDDAEAAALVADHVEQHLTQAGYLTHEQHLLRPSGKKGSAVVLDVSPETLIAMQDEAIACAAWNKRFAAALFGDPDDGAEEEKDTVGGDPKDTVAGDEGVGNG